MKRAASPWARTNWHTRPKMAARPGSPSPRRRTRIPIPEYTVYNSITFVSAKTGLINGYSAPPRAGDSGQPDWLDAKDPTARREWPHLSIMLDTRDGGKTWNPSTASMFGRIARTCFLPDGRGLGLIEFTDTFKWPSEVHLLDGTTGKSEYRL
jgi:hypothetical protein